VPLVVAGAVEGVGAVQVVTHLLRRPLGVARLDGGEDRRMLGQRQVLVSGAT